MYNEQEEYVLEEFEYKGFKIRIVQDSDVEEPDYGDDEVFLSAESIGSGCSSYHIGRKNYENSGRNHLQWGQFEWSVFGPDIPEPVAEEDDNGGAKSQAWDLYNEWLTAYDPSYEVFPIHCGNAHGPGSFSIYEIIDDEDFDKIEGYVYIKVPEDVLSRIGDASRDVNKMKDALIEQYEQWCNGDVWCYDILDTDGEIVESCGGYYGSYDCKEMAKETVDSLATKNKKQIQVRIIRTDGTWRYEYVDLPLCVGDNTIVEWLRENTGLGQDEDIEEVILPREGPWLFTLTEKEGAAK